MISGSRLPTPGGTIFVLAVKVKIVAMKKTVPVFVSIFLGCLFGCTKEDALVIERKHWLLVNKKWQLSGMSIKSPNGTQTNAYDSLPSFRKDDYFIFRPDSTYEFNDNMDTMPGKNSKLLDAGSWKLKNNESV